jgi:superoxide oxidase
MTSSSLTANPPLSAAAGNGTGGTGFRYGSALVAMHWLMLLLMVAMYASIELRVLYAKGTEPREFMKALHFMFGLSVLFMVMLRLAARWASPQPTAADHGYSRTVQLLSAGGHLALYALMIGMPILGWLTLSAAGKPIPFFGLELPALVAPDKTLAKSFKELHETVGQLSYWLIGLHAVAALGHHYVLKDGVLRRMRLMR